MGCTPSEGYVNIQNINYFLLLFFHGGFPSALCISMYFTTACGVLYVTDGNSFPSVKTLSNASFMKFAMPLLFLPFHEQKPPRRHLRRFPQQVKTVAAKNGNPLFLLLQVNMSPFNVKRWIG